LAVALTANWLLAILYPFLLTVFMPFMEMSWFCSYKNMQSPSDILLYLQKFISTLSQHGYISPSATRVLFIFTTRSWQFDRNNILLHDVFIKKST
jgi:hypothetical protein